LSSNSQCSSVSQERAHLGIAILNAVSTNVRVYFVVLGMLCFVTHHLIACLYRMKQNRGPVISRFIHTETQDGKCLINVHFAHATFKVHRWLKSVQQNMLKKATTPRELADALASDGGKPNFLVYSS
jgi:hypothetical protein